MEDRCLESMEPELRLVVLAAREGLDSDTRSRLETLISGPMEPQWVLQLCREHKVGPLVLDSLGSLSVVSSFLPAVKGPLETWCGNRFRVLTERIAAVLQVTRDLFNRAGIPFMFIRGLPFAHRFYTKPGLRVCSDVDMLVRPEDRDRALDALGGADFRPFACGHIRKALDTYVGQAEFRYRPLRTFLDLNWFMNANGGVNRGKQDAFDVAHLWERASRVDGCEWQMSVEDTFLHHVRHVAQGHDFDSGTIQCCADVRAMMGDDGAGLDWQRICEYARELESARPLRFFARFYDTYYRDEASPAITPLIADLGDVVSTRECAAFCRWVAAPLTDFGHRPRGIVRKLRYGNTYFLGKLWATDRVARLLRIVKSIPWPTRTELVVMTQDLTTNSYLRRRLAWYFGVVLPCLPGGCAGIAVRLLSALARTFARPRRVDRDSAVSGDAEEGNPSV